MADKQRVRRVGELIQREIAVLLQREIKDPRVEFVTISAVNVNRDLSVARIYYTLINQNQSDSSEDDLVASKARAQEGLVKASGYIRRLIGKQLLLRIVPRLDFVYDKSIEHGARMSNYIDDLIAQDKKNSQNF